MFNKQVKKNMINNWKKLMKKGIKIERKKISLGNKGMN
jgi:hypothetical protein